MKNNACTPVPLFGTYRWFVSVSDDVDDSTVVAVQKYLAGFDSRLSALDGYEAVRGFLESYASNEATFNSYRTHAERLLLWSLLIRERPLLDLRRSDAEEFLNFCMSPPPGWIGKIVRNRYLSKNYSIAPNPDWRPFATSREANCYKLTAGSIAQIFRCAVAFMNTPLTKGFAQ